MQITIDHAGRVVIPKPLRERAGLTEGTPLNVEYRDGRIEIEPACEPVKLVRKGEVWVAEGARRRLTNAQVRKTMQSLRDERGAR